jgi:hypothetical protein
MNNLISFPSYMRDDHGLFYGGRLYRRGTAEIREAVSDRDWQRLYARWMRKPVLEIRSRFGGKYYPDNAPKRKGAGA